MINAVVIQPIENNTEKFDFLLAKHCPSINVAAKVNDIKHAHEVVDSNAPKLIFLDLCSIDGSMFHFLNHLAKRDLEFIVLTDSKEVAFEAIKFSPVGYLLKPIDPIDLTLAIQNARKRLKEKEEYHQQREILCQIKSRLSEEDLVGIPTMEGYDFVKIKEIIRCKGMQRCTQIVTKGTSNIVSSYNLGEFRKLLEPFSFFSPHKSHVINLNCIKQYKREGAILMSDNVNVPVARRRRSDFLKAVKHI